MKIASNSVAEGMGQPGSLPKNNLQDGLRVLVIDDDKYMRSVIGRLLGNLGVAEYREATDGMEGLRAIETAERPFDLTIVDIDMPDSDGMEFLRLISQREYKLPIMVLSGKPAALLNSVEIMAKEYGLNLLRVAPKPASIALLGDVLNSCRTLTQPKPDQAAASYSPEEILAALENREFEPYFQPKVEIPTRRLTGCEALARWRHHRDGILGPNVFIGVIEAAQRMDQFTWLVLEQAASWCHRWHNAGLELTVNVNLSMSSLSDKGVADRFVDIVRSAGIEPRYIVLEVTETVAMTDMAQCLESLCRLRLRGFGLSIDDFGTGFSSLQQLTRVPYTELKIDQVFVNGAARSPRQRAVLESSIDMAKKLGLASVAEGVETQEDWNLLHKLGCQMAQGYFVAKPVSGEEFTVWARSQAQPDTVNQQPHQGDHHNIPFAANYEMTEPVESNTNMRRVRILVVEDEPFQQRILRDVLKYYMDFRGIMEADSSAAAISMFEDGRFDLILGDIEMPGMNGLELLRHIRTGQTNAPRDMRFIVLTSHSDTEVLGAAMALDVNGFIVKPFKTGVILDKITRALSQQLILRSDSDYGSVVTEIASLRRAQHKAAHNPKDILAVVAAGHELRIPLAELRAGMRVAKNIKAKDDTVILAAETTLTEATINHLSDLSELLAGGVVTVYHPTLESKVEQQTPHH